MYVPRFNAMTDPAEALALVTSVGAAELVTTGPDGDGSMRAGVNTPWPMKPATKRVAGRW